MHPNTAVAHIDDVKKVMSELLYGQEGRVRTEHGD